MQFIQAKEGNNKTLASKIVYIHLVLINSIRDTCFGHLCTNAICVDDCILYSFFFFFPGNLLSRFVNLPQPGIQLRSGGSILDSIYHFRTDHTIATESAFWLPQKQSSTDYQSDAVRPRRKRRQGQAAQHPSWKPNPGGCD